MKMDDDTGPACPYSATSHFCGKQQHSHTLIRLFPRPVSPPPPVPILPRLHLGLTSDNSPRQRGTMMYSSAIRGACHLAVRQSTTQTRHGRAVRLRKAENRPTTRREVRMSIHHADPATSAREKKSGRNVGENGGERERERERERRYRKLADPGAVSAPSKIFTTHRRKRTRDQETKQGKTRSSCGSRRNRNRSKLRPALRCPPITHSTLLSLSYTWTVH
ncbi:hypothetical protein B0J12DRAFT_668551 [Macrophomina phaseolina]|uniref:Uncharacterized protein n=1 Tax=Macrophomina phaseolina TaxID=35725 RepID=A0ABQ8G855_9PEZI|nr:hypothetical protein B0J12DRAFT_668551 [Macrophomina phaseolina]